MAKDFGRELTSKLDRLANTNRSTVDSYRGFEAPLHGHHRKSLRELLAVFCGGCKAAAAHYFSFRSSSSPAVVGFAEEH